MTLAQRIAVGRWMTDHAEEVAQMTAETLANAIAKECEIVVSNETAVRTRKQIGIVAVRQPKTERVKLPSWRDDVNARLRRLEAVAGLELYPAVPAESQE
jgi:hypothetical protein